MSKIIQRKVRAGLVVALALVLGLCMAGASVVYASPPPMPWDITTDPAATTDEAAITKVLKVPYGTEYPAMDFTFKIEAVSFNGSTTAVASVPAVPAAPVAPAAAGEVIISFDGSAAVSPSEHPDAVNSTAATDVYYLESPDIFAGVVWPSAGIYEYKITETATSYSILDPLHEALTLSLAEYMILVYVMECEDALTCTHGPGNTPIHTTGEIFIAAIGAVKVISDAYDPIINPGKANPTPGGDGSATIFYSQLAFTNNYVKTNGSGDPDDPDPQDPTEATLNISKEVDGDFKSFTQYFKFELTLALPSLIPAFIEPFYPAYVLDEFGAIVSPIPPATGTSDGNAAAALIDTLATGTLAGTEYIKFVPGTATTFYLKHGEQLVFINTPVGTGYALSETGSTGYTPNVTVTYDSSTTPVSDTGVKDAGYALPSTAIPAAANLFVSEEGSSVLFVNDTGGTTPTGLDISDLPFIGLIIIALGAFAAWILVKSRKRRSYN